MMTTMMAIMVVDHGVVDHGVAHMVVLDTTALLTEADTTALHTEVDTTALHMVVAMPQLILQHQFLHPRSKAVLNAELLLHKKGRPVASFFLFYFVARLMV
jgi:hypothetical protein